MKILSRSCIVYARLATLVVAAGLVNCPLVRSQSPDDPTPSVDDAAAQVSDDVRDNSGGGAAVDYPQVEKLLRTYCAGCHNDQQFEAEFSVESHAQLMAGVGQEESVITAGEPDASRLLQLMIGEEEPRMPPEGEPHPSAEEIRVMKSWIAAGAKGPDLSQSSAGMRLQLDAPDLRRADTDQQLVSAACRLPDGQLAVGMLQCVKRFRPLEEPHSTADPRRTGESWIKGLAGKVNSLRLSADQRWLVVGGGVAGLGGEIVLVDLQDTEREGRFQGHNDIVYAATLSPNGRLLASGSYDHGIIVWDVQSGEPLHRLDGHNGAIYDLDFDPSGQVLASASADQTVKLWRVETGQRLDTLGQAEGEMLCVRFAPDGMTVFAGGADRQIRQWQLASKTRSAINPMLAARFAHQREVLALEFIDGDRLLSGSSDLSIKAWTTDRLQPLGEVLKTDEVPVGICAPGLPDQEQLFVVDLKGGVYNLPLEPLMRLANADETSPEADGSDATRLAATDDDDQPTTNVNLATEPTQTASLELPQPNRYTDQEPNDKRNDAIPIELPAEIEGTIDPGEERRPEDVDLYVFSAHRGEKWLIEIDTRGRDSQLDSKLEILDSSGAPVLRTRLQSVRESYFTFRGKDSSTSDDFRLHKWEEMELDEYLYSSGEVTKLWLYPRGPDSGFKVYPGFGERYTYFDTTPIAHALGEPAYIVRQLGAEESPMLNGLPVFPIYFENDDDPRRKAGSDSRLAFIAPESGQYHLRIRDARGFGGTEYPYRCIVRKPNPDFSLAVNGNTLSIPRGSGQEWSVTADRKDGLQSAIRIELIGLPEGVAATNPLIIEAGQAAAVGTIFVEEAFVQKEMVGGSAARSSSGNGGSAADENGESEDEQEQAGEDEPTFQIELVASCVTDGREIEHQLDQQLKFSVTEGSGVRVGLVRADNPKQPLEELSIRPGQTVSARVIVDRNEFDNRIPFGGDDSGRNLPHGAYVDNIGLNGLLISEGTSEREFFITAAPKLKPGRRQFHLRSQTPGNPTSRAVWLNVLPSR